VAAGADRFIAKPFDPVELEEAVSELLEGDGRAR
jgi:DNA-binding response OmpR family regulator